MILKKKSKFSLVRASKNTLDGMKVLWQQEQSFRAEIYLSMFLIPCIFFIKVPSFVKLVLVLLLFLMLVVEALNSAIEAVIDRISLERHPQSKIAKDLGSAAVGMTQCMNVVAWAYAVYLRYFVVNLRNYIKYVQMAVGYV